MESSQCFEIYKSKLTFQPDFNPSWFDKIVNLIRFCYINSQQRGLVYCVTDNPLGVINSAL